MKTVARIQWTYLIISFSIFFGFLTLGYVLINFLIFQGQILIDRVVIAAVFLVNIGLSAFLGWRLYKRRWHAIFRYDQEGVDLMVGHRRSANPWSEFKQVSLFHQGYGRFSVRLYRNDSEFVEIPTSDLRMDASGFRFEAMGLVQKGGGSE